jgi:glycosyltransferase involved in cell wall biosynthesis
MVLSLESSAPLEPPRASAINGVHRASRMRVCFVIEAGTDVRTVDGMAERFDLTVVARRIVDGVEISQPPEHRVNTIIGPASRTGFGRLVAQYLFQNRSKFDYVIVQGYGLTALVANMASRVTRIPTAMLVVSPVEAYYRCRLSNPQEGKPFRLQELKVFEALAWLNAKFGRRYLVPSNHLGDTIRAYGTTKPIDFVPIYGVDTSIFRPFTEAKKSLRVDRGLPESGQVLFFSSRIAPEKDSRTMLFAFKKLIQQGRDVWLLHRSGGYKEFHREALRIGAGDRVIATDAVHPHRDLPLDYNCSDLCIQASREEGLGFSPLEAMACGIPVVASAVGGLKETVVDGDTGWTCPVGDVAALARSIETVLDNPAEAERRSRAGRKLVCERFERKMAFDRLETILSAEAGLEVRAAS